MQSRWFPAGNNPAFWRVAFALLLSVLLHFILLGFVHIDLSIFEPEKEVIEVRFASLVKTPPPKPVQEVEPAIEMPSPPAPPAAVESPAPIEAEQLPVTPAIESAAQEQISPEVFAQENIAGESEELIPEAVPEIQPVLDTQPEPVNEVAADTQPLSFVETEFDIFRGIDGNKIGQTKIHFQSRDDGTYVIKSESEAKGLASLFISGKLIQRSEGNVTEHGLQPISFLYQYDGNSGKNQRASFDWENRRITLETDKGTQSMRLPRDAQDLVSFMYQFMFVPPLQEMQLNITNGKRLKAYGYSFVGEVDLSTKMGIVRAMHLENINDDGDEKNEIWLAVDYRYLPVKIRKTEKDGSVIEQVVTNIKTDILQ